MFPLLQRLLSVNWVLALVLSVGVSQSHAAPPETTIETVPLAEGLYMMTGSGGNMGLSVGADGAILIDDQFAPLSEKILAAVAKLTDQPIKYLVNTHWHYDHTGGNENMGRQGAIIVAHDRVRERLAEGGVIEAFKHEELPAPAVALPVVTFDQTMTFHFNNEVIRIEHPAPAHTDGDAIIYFENANVVHMGDTFFNGMYPFIDASSGGNMLGVIHAVESTLAKIDDNTKVIPGHGALGNKAQLVAYHHMLKELYHTLSTLKSAGKSVADVVAAKPTAKFDAQWGSGFLKPDQWVAITYETL